MTARALEGGKPSRVVVTGASSGIGRATAHALASRGMHLVLASRDPGTLEDAVLESKARGAASVSSVPTDVGDPEAVQELGRAAGERMDGIDVWVNNASVMAYGRFEDLPTEVYRRVLEVNLFGTIEGSRVALRHFRESGSGHLINIGSLYGKMASPLVGPYVTSKYGVQGFTEVLRQETIGEPHVHVSLVLPGSMDTPIFRHAANFVGRATRPVPPVSDVRRVARAVARLVDRPKAVVVVGNAHRALSWAHALFPRLYDQLVPGVMEAAGLEKESTEVGAGNVFESWPDLNRMRGPWTRKADLAAIGRGAVAAGRRIVGLVRSP